MPLNLAYGLIRLRIRPSAGIFRPPEVIIGTWRAARVEQDDITEDEAREALLQFAPLWDELFPAEQARIVQLLVEPVRRADARRGG